MNSKIPLTIKEHNTETTTIMTEILPPPPAFMLKEANKEQAKYMNEMLRIALSIKEFRIHAKPIISKKLAETPSAKCINERIKIVNYTKKFYGSNTGETCIEYLTRLEQFNTIKSALFETSQFTRNKIQEKHNKKQISQYYDLYNTSTYNIIAWRLKIIERIVYEYFKFNHQIKRKTPISLEKMCALAIAFIMIRKTQRWESVCVNEIERFLETKEIMNYCLKYSPESIIKKRKLLLNVNNSWTVQNY